MLNLFFNFFDLEKMKKLTNTGRPEPDPDDCSIKLDKLSTLSTGVLINGLHIAYWLFDLEPFFFLYLKKLKNYVLQSSS